MAEAASEAVEREKAWKAAEATAKGSKVAEVKEAAIRTEVEKATPREAAAAMSVVAVVAAALAAVAMAVAASEAEETAEVRVGEMVMAEVATATDVLVVVVKATVETAAVAMAVEEPLETEGQRVAVEAAAACQEAQWEAAMEEDAVVAAAGTEVDT